jgi:hypothetical protein
MRREADLWVFLKNSYGYTTPSKLECGKRASWATTDYYDGSFSSVC